MFGSESPRLISPSTFINSPGGAFVQNLFLEVLRNRDCPFRTRWLSFRSSARCPSSDAKGQLLRVHSDLFQARVFLPGIRDDAAAMSPWQLHKRRSID